jgi:putative DNA primase/helicase
MSELAQSDIVEAFKLAMAADGILTRDEIIPDLARIRRFHVEGDRRGTRNGFYKVHTDNLPAGMYGSWKRNGGEVIHWRWNGPRPKAIDTVTWKKRVAEAERQRKQEEAQRHEHARVKAQNIWGRAEPAADDHPYLVRKKVQPHGLRMRWGRLLLPLRDIHGNLWSLQSIDGLGNKKFLPGGRKQGCFHLLGSSNGRVFLAEGYCTSATVHEVTGQEVAVAFDCGNLLPVARALRATRPKAEMVIAADDDPTVKDNPGLTKAQEAAKAVNAKLLVPKFSTAQRGEHDTDFNDLARLEGMEVVKRQLRMGPAPYEAPTVTEFLQQRKNMPPKKPW